MHLNPKYASLEIQSMSKILLLGIHYNDNKNKKQFSDFHNYYIYNIFHVYNNRKRYSICMTVHILSFLHFHFEKRKIEK